MLNLPHAIFVPLIEQGFKSMSELEHNNPDAFESENIDNIANNIDVNSVDNYNIDNNDINQTAVLKNRHKSNKSALVLLYSLVIFVILLVCAFLGTQAYFHDRVAPGVHFAGSSQIVGAQLAAVSKNVDNAVDSTKIEIKDDRGKTINANFEDLYVKVDKSATVKNIMRSKHDNAFTMLMPWVQKTVALQATRNDMDMDAYIIKKFVNDKDRAMPYTAKYDSGSESYVVEDGVPGRTVITLPVREAVKKSLENPGKTVKVTIESRRIEAPIKRDVAKKTVDQLNNILTKKITLSNGDSKDFTIPKSAIASWIKVNADEQRKQISFTVDREAVNTWLSKELAKNLNQQKIDQEDTYSKKGQFIMTTLKGVNGVEVRYSKDVANKVVDTIEKGTDAKITVPTNVVKFAVEKKIVEMRIVVDKTTQTVSVYKDDQLIRTMPVCTGSNGYYETPNGTFHIYLRYDVQAMQGFNRDGSRYYLPGITWVSYFNGGISFHTARWNDVGIAQGYPAKHGSHGCINMYEQDSKWVYDNCPRGTIVQVVGEQPDGPVRQ